jgi:uncharacterized protein
MKKSIIVLALTGLGCMASAGETTRAGIPMDAAWKKNLYQFAEKDSTDTAWGLAHSERDYLLSISIAKGEGLAVDSDVLFAAAFLHDIGAQKPYAKDDVKHEPRAVEVMGPILQEAGFPMEKQALLAEVILRHMYYSAPGLSPEAVVFRDADTLDGLGVVGAVRVFSQGGREDGWAPSLGEGLDRIKRWQTDLPRALSTATARGMAQRRVEELRPFLERLQDESVEGKAL